MQVMANANRTISLFITLYFNYKDFKDFRDFKDSQAE